MQSEMEKWQKMTMIRDAARMRRDALDRIRKISLRLRVVSMSRDPRDGEDRCQCLGLRISF
jgi:hypothetical protein